MSQTKTVIQYTEMKLKEIVQASIGKPIPNWFNIEDMQGFGMLITEGDLNFVLNTVAYPVDEAGPGNFLIKLQASFMSPATKRQGYEFTPSPIGTSIELDFPLFAETEQELMDGVLQLISDEAENILCQVLE